MAISVIVAIGDDIANQLVDQLKIEIAKIKMGSGEKADVDMFHSLHRNTMRVCKSYIELGKQEGASLVVDNSKQKPTEAENADFHGRLVFLITLNQVCVFIAKKFYLLRYVLFASMILMKRYN